LANQHRYGLRWVRSLSGAEQPQILRFPVSDTYQATTIVGAGTNVNLNVGDPVKLGEDGCIKLVQAGQDQDGGANTDSDDYIFGVIAGFERTWNESQGVPEQKSYVPGGTDYAGGIGGDQAPIALVIPAAGNVFEIDADAALATPTKAGALAQVGRTGRIVYSVLSSGVVGAPKANPLLDISVVEAGAGGADQNQLVVVGLGAKGDAMDFTATNVTFQVMATAVQLHPAPDTVYGANVE